MRIKINNKRHRKTTLTPNMRALIFISLSFVLFASSCQDAARTASLRPGVKQTRSNNSNGETEDNSQLTDTSTGDDTGSDTETPDTSIQEQSSTTHESSGSTATRENLGAQVDNALDSFTNKDFTSKTSDQDARVFKDYFLYMFKIVNDFAEEGNTFTLLKDKLYGQAFFNASQSMVALYNLQADPDKTLDTITPDFMNKELGKLGMQSMSMGKTASGKLLELKSAFTQNVQIDAEGTILSTDTEFGLESAAINENLIEGTLKFYGLHYTSADGNGQVQQVVFNNDGSADLTLKDADGETKSTAIVGENFIYFFVWFIYKFESNNASVKPWLEAALATIPHTPKTIEFKANDVQLTNKALEIFHYTKVIGFFSDNGCHFNINIDYLKDSSFEDYSNFYRFVIQKGMKDAGMSVYLDQLAAIETFPPNGNGVDGKKGIVLHLRDDLLIKQGATEINVPKETIINYTDNPREFELVGLQGSLSSEAAPVNLRFKNIRIEDNENRLAMDVHGQAGAFIFQRSEEQTEYFDLGGENATVSSKPQP